MSHPAETRSAPPSPSHQIGSGQEPQLSSFLQEFADRSGSALVHVAKRPVAAIRAGRALLALPRLSGTLSDSVEGRAIHHEFSRFSSRRWLLGLSTVLEIPLDGAQYRTGSSKQTLRRKIRVTEQHGVTWHRVEGRDERLRLLELANLHERMNEHEQYRIAAPDNDDLPDYRLWLVACANDGAPLLLSVTPYDGHWATLRYFRTLTCADDASEARYLMTAVLVQHLSELGVRFLIDAAVPHWLPNGLRHFQRMLGFRLVRLQLALAG